MKKIETIVTNPILVGIIMLKDLIDIFKSIITVNGITFNNINIDWWNFIIKFVIAVSLWLILRAYFDLKNKFNEQMMVFSIIAHTRNKRLFIKSFENTEYCRLPNQTDEEFWNRLPEGGLFKQHFYEEYLIVREELQNKRMKNKSLDEIDDILSKWYPFAKKKVN